MSDEYIVGVIEGALTKVKERITRAGGTVTGEEGFSSTMRVTGKTRRELLAFPGVRFVEAGGPRGRRGL